MSLKSPYKRKGPCYWKAKDNESDTDSLSWMRSLEAQLIRKRKLHTVKLPDGCVITATKERLSYILEVFNIKSPKQ